MTERTLDRRVDFDERSRAFPARALTTAATPRSYTWGVPALGGSRPLDQGREGACVGFAWAHEAAARPVVRDDADTAMALRLYRAAQKLDPWPGEDYDGTSVLAGAKAARAAGLIDSYRWSFSMSEALTVVSRHGPAVLGINWYESMYETDRNGYVRVGGALAGGHAILLTGVSLRHQRATLYNSWGPGWGVQGRGYITFHDLDRLLREDGECCVPVVRRFR